VSLTDIGANLTHASFRNDLEEVLARAREAGVGTIVVTGTTIAESRAAAALAEAHPQMLWATAGVHPHHACECDAQTIPALRELAGHPRVVALGECGLDFNRNYSPHPDQEKWFAAQLELACELGKPLFLHSRDAHPRFADILRAQRARLGFAAAAAVQVPLERAGGRRGQLSVQPRLDAFALGTAVHDVWPSMRDLSSALARWIRAFTVPSGRCSASAISSYDRSCTWRSSTTMR